MIFKEVLLFVKSVKETHYTYKEHIEVSIIVYIQMLQCIYIQKLKCLVLMMPLSWCHFYDLIKITPGTKQYKIAT